MKSNKIRKKINTKIKNKIKSENFSSNSNLKTSINSSKNKYHNSKSISFKFENKTEETKKQLNNQKIINNLPLKKIQPTKFIQNEPSTSSRTENNEKISEFKKSKSLNKKSKNLNKSFSTKKNKEELIINSSNNIISELRAYSNFRDKFNDLLEQESEKSPTKTLLHSKTEKKQLKNSVLKINNKSRNNNETFSQSKTERIDTTVSLNQNETENLIEKK